MKRQISSFGICPAGIKIQKIYRISRIRKFKMTRKAGAGKPKQESRGRESRGGKDLSVMEFKHYPVMLKEAASAAVKASKSGQSGLVFIDGTLGGGGYSLEMLKRLPPDSRLIAFDIDKEAIAAASEKLKNFNNAAIVHDSYTNIKKYLADNGIKSITGGIVFDFGASMPQLTSDTRGFSFMKNSKLDMRFNQESDFSAYDVINSYKEQDLARIFSEYGEERFSKRIAKKIAETRRTKKIETTQELVNIILSAAPRIKSKIHPASRVFQAVRIEVNNELNNIQTVLNDVIPLLAEGAVIAAVSFHSLEDRIVKNTFKKYLKRSKYSSDTIDEDMPVLELLYKKPLAPSEAEIKENPPSRSAKLRAAECIKSKSSDNIKENIN